jgi:hypothetical protein
MSDIAARIARLSPEKLQLLADRLSDLLPARPRAKSAPVKNAPGSRLPLSFGQERLWFLNRIEPDTAVYNIPRAVSIQGSLNINTLAESFGEIIRRHESLRTTFSEVDGQPVQIIGEPQAAAIPLIDLSFVAQQDREAHARLLLHEEARLPFDLVRGPLFRLKLLRLSEQVHILLLTLHHIIWDAWSIAILIEEMMTLYKAYSRGERSPLAGLDYQYANFALLQRETIQNEPITKQLAYWKQKLAGAPLLLEFPSNTITADGSSHEGATHNREISTSLVSALRLLARQSDATLFTVLLAAFNLVLRHLSGKQDIVVGTMIAGRPQRETERLIGFFINTLVLRNQLSGISSFGGLVSQSRRVVLEAMDNQDVPFDKVVKALRPERSLTHAPLFQVVFTLQNVPMPQMILPDMKLEVLEVSRGVVPFDLNLNLLERDDSITASLEYRAGRFDASAADRLLAQYELVLRMIVENPETTLEAIEESLVELDKQEWAEKEKELKAIREQKFKVARRRRVVSL